jgi:hypothetical protein
LDLKFTRKNPKTGYTQIYTNREWMKKGNNPYVKVKDGKAVPTEQHHSQQKGSGPIFEIKQTTHKNPVNKKALHPYGKKKNPNNPVNRKVTFCCFCNSFSAIFDATLNCTTSNFTNNATT